MKKRSFIGVFLVLVSFSAGAQAESKKAHSFTYGASFGLLSGEAEEIVYRSSSTDKYNSHLLWQMKPLLLAGINLRYDWQNRANSTSAAAVFFSGFFVDASFDYGIPGKTGLMEDRDWRMPQTNWLTDYSVHDNKTRSALFANLEIGKSFPINEFRLSVFLSYRFMHFSFAASGGSFLYPPDSEAGHSYEPKPADIVTYRQRWHVISPGVSFYGEFNRYFDIDISFRASPLIFSSSFDEHLDLYFEIVNSNMAWGLFVEPGLVFSFKPVPLCAITFSLSYTSISGTRGDSTYKYTAYSDTYRDIGGAGYSAFDAAIGVKFNAF